MKKAVFGLASNDAQAQKILDRLLASGFSNDDISILYPDSNKKMTKLNDKGELIYNEDLYHETYGDKHTKKNKGHISTENTTKAPEGAAAGATAGGFLGGTLGLLSGIGALAIPGLGPFIAAGPILSALSGSAIGGSLGLLIGGLVGSGIPEYEAKKYEAGLKSGNILMSVHADNDKEIDRAEEILKSCGAKDISASSESSND